MRDRTELLHILVADPNSSEDVVEELRRYPFDSDEQLATVTIHHIASALRIYLRGEISAATLERWADAIECRDDLKFPASDVARSVLYRLANPVLEGEISTVRAEAELRGLGLPTETPELLNLLHRKLHDGLTLLAEPELLTATQWHEDWAAPPVELFHGVTSDLAIDDRYPEYSAWLDEVFSRETAAAVRRFEVELWEYWPSHGKNGKHMPGDPAQLPSLDDWDVVVQLARRTLALIGERPDGPDVWGVQDLRRLSETH